MSFRSDGQRRYGHVPPVQYPVADQAQDQPSYPARRPSFNNGDDSSFFDQGQDQATPQGYPDASAPSVRGPDELFLTSPTDPSANRPSYGSANSAMSGYQHQFQAAAPPAPSHSTYNPQHFARSQSTSLPYHPQPPVQRYSSTSAGSNTAASPTNYTPAAYNPAAYASATSPQRAPTQHGYNNNYNQGYTSPTIPQAPIYGMSPASTYNQSFPQSAQAPARHDQPLPSPGFSSNASTTSQTPSYDPSYNQSYGNNYGNYASNGNSPAPAPYPTGTSQAPYPLQSHIPVGPAYSADPSSFYTRTSRSNSSTSPLHSPQIHSPGLQRHPTHAPLPSRPMDYVSEEATWEPDERRHENDQARYQEDIMHDIEAELGSINRHRPAPVNGGQFSDDELQQLRRYTTSSTTLNPTDSSNVSRFSSNASTNPRDNASSTFDYDDDDDDPEGTAGVLAMQQAEMDDRRFSTAAGGPGPYPYTEPVPVSTVSTVSTMNTLPPPAEEQSSDTDYGGMDLGLFSGGYAGNLAYGNSVASPPADQDENTQRPLPDPTTYPQPSYDAYEGAPAFKDAGVDYGDTGGLQPPTAHRLSFDEGDERVSLHSRQSTNDSPNKEEYPDIFYHPGLTNRPLPALPPAPSSDSGSMLSPQGSVNHRHSHGHSLSVDSRHMYPPEGPEAYYGASGSASPYPERSISLSSHSNTPQVHAPARSRTDAAEERRKLFKQMTQQQQQQYLTANHGNPQEGYESGTPSSMTFDMITLPSGRRRKFVPQEGYESGTPSSMTFDMITLPSGRRRKFVPGKLTAADFGICTEPWALSGIAAWIREMADGEPDLKQKTVEEALVALFTVKVPTINVADAEVLSTTVVELLLDAQILIPEEEWVKFGPGTVSGVLWQLTGSGCYASKLHENEAPGRCYSYHCMRTLKKANLDDLMLDETKVEGWAEFFKVTKEMVEGKPKKEVERQNVLHEIVTSEETYMNQLEVLRVLYRDQIQHAPSPIIAPNRVDKFVAVVFGKVDAVLDANKENLLAQLKYRQQEQGPWIVGFSDLFREWIRKARDVYIDYASQYPHASYLVRREKDRNIIFAKFLDEVRGHKRSTRLDWTHFLKTPITRLQRYTFLLQTVEKNMLVDSEEKANLAKAISEIHNVTLECDQKVAEMQKKVEMMELNAMLVLRPGFHSVLNLDHLGRELILQGELTRMGHKGVRWVDTHALLFDHYLILAKPVSSRDGRGGRKFDVSKEPIPMPLLFLDSMNDDPISKQKGIAPLARGAGGSTPDNRLGKITSNGGDRPTLEHAATSSSIGSVSVSRLTPTISNDSKDKILYPFKIKHLGHETYTLFATTPDKRADWVQKIIEAKTRHAKALFSQNAEPFRLRVLADSSFAYDSVSAIGKTAGVPVRGTPLDRAIRELEQVYGPGRAAPVCRAQVNCATGFTAYGKSIIAIGTDYGVYISDTTDPRGWTRTVQVNRVTQITVLEEFSVCLIIADRSLISYPLDVVAPVSNFPAPVHDNPRRAPQRLGKDVAFFASARMKERMLVFYKRKEGMHNTFKVLEPVFHKSSEKKSRLFGGRRPGGGATEAFRDYDEFYLPTECYSLNLFQSYIAISTAKGFELLTLDKKQPMSIPDLREPAIANIATRIRDQRPLGMFRLNDQEFLLAYEDCAVYVDKHGDQLGEESKSTVKISMSHPEIAGTQIVLEMLLNDGHTEK
ncbi:Rho1 guanine nucleotide exchange factor 3 like protein [Verticillium longisporum]|uniref:Rho1 guanine nucleotide exchange factor 3 like protein n=1 Tax=Verticillium longisporum TaxID=100787 RepID=A0A8I3AUL4_VERLO|nr:Rho1 guanine nucleotide exchange factor 3 like protein [Verticillium longisporum]